MLVCYSSCLLKAGRPWILTCFVISAIAVGCLITATWTFPTDVTTLSICSELPSFKPNKETWTTQWMWRCSRLGCYFIFCIFNVVQSWILSCAAAAISAPWFLSVQYPCWVVRWVVERAVPVGRICSCLRAPLLSNNCVSFPSNFSSVLFDLYADCFALNAGASSR